MFKKFNLFLVFGICLLFVFVDKVNAEQWVYQRMALTSHHLMSYNSDRDVSGRANLHVIEDVDTASSYNAGDGVTRYAYCADVDTGGYAGVYVRSLINDSDYNGNGARMRAILSSSYPYVTLDEMKALYKEQMGVSKYNENGIANMTYQEAIYVSQAAVWSISNPNRTPFVFSHNMADSDMLKLTHARIGLTCDWSVTDPDGENYCYPSVASANYEKDEVIVNRRVSAMVDWLLSLDGSEIDGSGDLSIEVLSKTIAYDIESDKNRVVVTFKVVTDNLTSVSSLSNFNVKVLDTNSNEVSVDYKDGIYTISEEYNSDIDSIGYDISVNYSSKYGKKAYLYKSSGQQDLVSVEDSRVTKEVSTDVNVEDDNEEVEISKVSITDSKELPGAMLKITDLEGNLIEEWTSTTEPHMVKLPIGKYILIETIAPEGYVTSSSIEFEVTKDGVNKVTMIDDVTKVLISKKDFTTEEEVVGAKIQIKDSDGNVVHEWVSSSEPHYIEKLPVGKYILIETVYPEGYEDSMIINGIVTSEYEFEVKDTGDIQTIDVYNRITTITDVPNTGIHKSIIFGVMIMIIGVGAIVVSRKRNLV